jgi:glutamate-ammonia-ligase adenylyltransferase
MDSLRAYKYECTLKIACLEIEQKITSFIAGKLLSKLAELCLNKAISWLMSKMPEVLIREHFMVVAYGRFAGEEMSYESDLDLIFLYREGCSQHDLFVRFVKKLIKFLSLSTSNGFLYQVDPRLRPSGSSGLLVSDLEQFREYQCEKAWTWEHQALIRSRVVFGNSSLESDFLEIRAKALSKPRELSALKSDICQMREKIKEHKGAGSQGIKLIEGGLVDLEFLLQFLILKAAHHLPGVLDCVGVLSQIVRLQAETAEEYQELADLQRCFLEFKKAEQSLLLGLSDTIERATAQQRVRELWHQFLN